MTVTSTVEDIVRNLPCLCAKTEFAMEMLGLAYNYVPLPVAADATMFLNSTHQRESGTSTEYPHHFCFGMFQGSSKEN